MKHGIRTIMALSALPILLSGCDLFRTIAGRPSSEELAAIKEAAAKVAALPERAASDTIGVVSDTLKSDTDSLETVPDTLKPVESKPSAPAKILSRKYYIVVGTFSSEENAMKLVSRAEEKSFPAVVFPFKGMAGVAVCGTDSRDEIMYMLPKVRSCGLFPKESWVYVNK